MTRIDQSWRRFAIWGACLALLFSAVSCTLFQSSDEDDEPQELVGAPPEDDDPFAYTGQPEETERVGRTGQLNEPEPDAGHSDANQSEPGRKPSAAASAERATPDESDDEQKPDRATPATTRDNPAEKQQFKCFSCVRICPAGETPCRRGNRDVICGWGVHENKESARELARAECDGALERERTQSQWSEISGECPPASCRTPE